MFWKYKLYKKGFNKNRMKITKQKLDIQQMDLPVVYLDEMTNEEICEQFGFRKLGNLNE